MYHGDAIHQVHERWITVVLVHDRRHRLIEVEHLEWHLARPVESTHLDFCWFMVPPVVDVSLASSSRHVPQRVHDAISSTLNHVRNVCELACVLQPIQPCLISAMEDLSRAWTAAAEVLSQQLEHRWAGKD